jgi:hypothetical protein
MMVIVMGVIMGCSAHASISVQAWPVAAPADPLASAYSTGH